MPLLNDPMQKHYDQLAAEAAIASRRVLIGIVGRAGSGKSTLARMLSGHGFSEESLAAPLKAVCAALFGWTEEQLFGPSALRDVPDPAWNGLTPRHALQTIGTDIARKLHQDVWVRALLSTLVEPGAPAKVCVSDVRFQNEINVLRKAGGRIVKLSRTGGAEERSVHASEQVDDLTGIDFWIDNSSTLDALAASAQALVEAVSEEK